MNGYTLDRASHGGALCAALGLLAACDSTDDDLLPTERAEAVAAVPNGQETAVPIGTFAARAPVDFSADDSRSPGGAARAIYVPATSLFPGSARVDPQIENPYAGDAEAIAAGERHFNAFNCSGCHAPWGGGGMGPPLSDDTWIHGGEAAQIYLSIMHGRPEGMPAWSSMLPQRTAWELVAYIQSLGEIQDFSAASGFERAGRDDRSGAAARSGGADAQPQ